MIGNAIRVAQIAAGEAEEEYEAKPEKNEAAAELGRKGGAAREGHDAGNAGEAGSVRRNLGLLRLETEEHEARETGRRPRRRVDVDRFSVAKFTHVNELGAAPGKNERARATAGSWFFPAIPRPDHLRPAGRNARPAGFFCLCQTETLPDSLTLV